MPGDTREKAIMNEISWYAEASLTSNSHVYCSGSLAQCVRRWARLSMEEKAGAAIKIGGRTEVGETLSREIMAALAENPKLHRV